MIQIHFYKPHTLFEKAVSFFGKTEYCHVAIQYGSTVVESTAGYGVRRRINYQAERSDLFFVTHSKSNDLMTEWVENKLGTHYGYADNAQSVLRKWLHWRLGGNPRGATCVEFACDFLYANCGMYVDYIQGMTPDELIARLKK